MTAAGKTLKRAKRLLFRLSWLYPFFSIPAARCRLTEDPATETASVTACGLIRVGPAYFATLSDSHALGVLAHEICHPTLGHHARFRGCDPTIANQATDMAINQGLREAGIELPPGALYPPDAWRTWSAEQIYHALKQQQAEQPDGGDGDQGPESQPAPGQGCGPLPPEGPESQDDSGDTGPGQRPDERRIAAEWRQVAVQAAHMQRSMGRGDGAGGALADLTKIPAPRVRWSSILRNGTSLALSSHSRDETSWSRRSRRSAPVGPQFPGWVAKNARIAVAIDTSGSMSDDMIAQAVAETVAAVRSSGVRAYLVTHDARIQWQGWVDPKTSADAIKARCTGRGGTRAREAYEAIAAQRATFDVFVHLTDCGLSWPSWPKNTRKRIVANTSFDDHEAPKGARIVKVEV